MNSLTANLNTLWASLLVEELVRNGITYFCLAPGSRCTPLTVAVADRPDVLESIHHDERGAAFHALGYGRATGCPAAIITTSGTAVANLMPAVVEASLEQIPLLVLTGDRPPELRDTCANQTIDQAKIFGRYVRWFVDLPCPTGEIFPAFVLTTADQAVYRCRHGIPGPVHINCMFREPLAPEARRTECSPYLKRLNRWTEGSAPYTSYERLSHIPNPAATDRVTDVLKKTEQGMVVIGDLASRASHPGVRRLLERLQWPVYADITSGFRMGDTTGLVIAGADLLMMHPDFPKDHVPEVVLHLGGRLVSKQVQHFLQHDKVSHYVLISDYGARQDPEHRVSERIEGNVDHVCFAVSDNLSLVSGDAWLKRWQNEAAKATACLEDFTRDTKRLSEPLVVRLISKMLPADHGLFLGNSMPVRSMNSFADETGPAVYVEANRGASGIDGTIATASGFAEGLRRPVTVLLGDLAFLHDLNSLNYLVRGKHPVVLLVINNDGGGIFSFLPIARFERYLERYFVTPHGLTFEKAAAMYGLPYFRPTDSAQLRDAYQQSMGRERSAVIEIPIDRKENHALQLRLVNRVHRAIEVERR